MFTNNLEAAMDRLDMRRALIEWEICMALEDRFLSDMTDASGDITDHYPSVTGDETSGVTASPYSVVRYD